MNQENKITNTLNVRRKLIDADVALIDRAIDLLSNTQED